MSLIKQGKTHVLPKMEVTAVDLVKPLGEGKWGLTNHPLVGAFKAWLNAKSNVVPTRRQARKFLAENPYYRVAKAA